MKYSRFITNGLCRPLGVINDRVYWSRGYELYTSTHDFKDIQLKAKFSVGFIKKYISKIRILSRITRAGFHSIAIDDFGGIVTVIKGAILYCPPGQNEFVVSKLITRGSRPLNVCVDPDNNFYFGEYFRNTAREEVNIFGYSGGQEWVVAYTFSPGTIRHVHGIYYDKFRKGMWVLTGDKNIESGIWFTQDEFSSLDPVVHGSQQARAVSVISRSDSLIVPMDTPLEKNYIQTYIFKTGLFSKDCEIPGSAFYAVQIDDIMFVSTVVEPSLINTDQRVSLYASSDGRVWHCINRFDRDFPQKYDKYLCYPCIVLPSNQDSTEFLYGYSIGLKNLDGMCLQWALKDVRAFLNNQGGRGA